MGMSGEDSAPNQASTALGFEIHPPQQVSEARVVAEGVESTVVKASGKEIRSMPGSRQPYGV